MRAGEFREDLYYRLKVIEIAVPPLRERPDELPRLIDFFVDKYARRYNRQRADAVAGAARARCSATTGRATSASSRTW